MDDTSFVSTGCSSNCFKEAVCIDAMRVYDSCSEPQPSGCHSCDASGEQRSCTSKQTWFPSGPRSLRQRIERTRRRQSLFSSAGDAPFSASSAVKVFSSRWLSGAADRRLSCSDSFSR